jgi:hypothetical protein
MDELVEREEAVMRGTRVASFELLQYAGGGCNGAVFLARCREGVGNPFWKCVEAAIADLPPASRHDPHNRCRDHRAVHTVEHVKNER